VSFSFCIEKRRQLPYGVRLFCHSFSVFARLRIFKNKPFKKVEKIAAVALLILAFLGV